MGDMMRTLDDAEKLLCKGIEEINKKSELNTSSLEMLGDAVDALKDIATIREKEMGGGSYERMMPYYGDGYERGRRRDSMGRFMDDGYRGEYRNDGYRGSYGHSDQDEREFLKWKMQNASNESEREMYRRKLEQM